MKATIDGITYEGTEEEIRHIVENPPHGTQTQVRWPDGDWGLGTTSGTGTARQP